MKKTKLTRSLMAACSIVALSAVMYGCVHSGDDAPPAMDDTPDPALGIAQEAARVAANAAEMASDDAATAANNVGEIKSYDPASYALARNAANNAMDAYMAAKAASNAAATTDDTAEAEGYQETAEDQRDAARDALADARMYAGMVRQAKMDADDAAQDAMDLAAAQRAAMEAAGEATLAYSEASQAVMAQDDNQSHDLANYTRASDAKGEAKAASQRAADANTLAQNAATPAEARTHQAAAETARDEAEAARDAAVNYANLVMMAATEAMDLATAKQAAMAAATAARAAADAARAAATEIAGIADASQADIDAAEMAARDAEDAALRAEDASARAQLDTESGDAEAEQKTAEDQLVLAESARDTATGLRDTAQGNANEAVALEMAQTKADEAATKADDLATEAEADAARVAELTGASSDQAVAAKKAAEAARAAATAAREASDAAQLDTVSGDAQAEQKKAEDQLTIAMKQGEKAEDYRREAQVAFDNNQVEQEKRDIAAAQEAAKMYAAEARDHYVAAMGKAADARAQADAAEAAAMRAMRARTMYADGEGYDPADPETYHLKGASTLAAEADVAADAAEAARDEAERAKNAASDAYMAAMAATTRDAAEDARDDAKDANAIATEKHMGVTDANGDVTTKGAGQYYMDASAANMAAMEAAGVHVLELLKTANAYDVDAPLMDPANTEEQELQAIAENKADHVAAVDAKIVATVTDLNNAEADTTLTGFSDAGSDGPSNDDTGTRWPFGTVVDVDDDGRDDDGLGDGVLTLEFVIDTDNFSVTRAEDDPETEDDESNFEPALGAFPHAFDLSSGGRRALVFTDKEQASAPVKARIYTYTNRPVPSHDGVTPTAAPMPPGDNQGDFTGTYDPDGDGPLPRLAGTFDCVDPSTCSVIRTGTGADGAHVTDQTKITSITGYNFTGSGSTTARVSMADQTYLVFGVWLDDDDMALVRDPADGSFTTNPYTFGAFATGESLAGDPSALTGGAMYTGSAAGVHSHMVEEDDEMVRRVDFFYGDATLEADFDVATDAAGHVADIHGTIENIYSAGEPLDGYGDNIIYLDLGDDATANVDTNGAFDGRARLGVGTQRSDREYNYAFEGLWSGSFYETRTDDPDTATVNESMPTHDAVAGTFGVTGMRGTDTGTESFVGAFGAHMGETDDTMNGN